MRLRLSTLMLALSCLTAPPAWLLAAGPSITGGPADTGYDVGSAAALAATLSGITGDAARYAVFAGIQYVGTTAVANVEMDRGAPSATGEARFRAEWPIPADAPTGLYSLTLSVEDRSTRETVATQRVRGFVVYRKLVRIARVDLDKTFYAPGETIESQIVLENLTDHPMKDLRIEFSNANYPWISTFSGEKSLSGAEPVNPALNLKVLRAGLNLAAHAEMTLPMASSGTAAFLQGTQVAVMGTGGPARNFKVPPPEVDQYTVAVWNAERTVLYDMVFSPEAIVRDPDRTLPKPYSYSFTHRYNSDIDFTKYREFYKPGETATADSVRDRNHLPASLLVFCPHEDDEHPWAGLIHAMLEAKLPVRVVFFTGGDVGACERYYSKACGPNEAREFGMVRMEESTEALEHIGLTRDRITFLGLPDGGSGAIWFEHQKVSNPFLSIYLATDHSPYENAYRPNLPYARDAVLDVVEQIIRDFHPAMIATPHPDERHVDHRTANWFAVKACQELLHAKQLDPSTIILADQAYGAGGYKPAPYHYEKYVVYLSGEAAVLKQEMGWIYQSQDGNIDEGMRKTFDELPRAEVHYRITDWQEHEGWNE
ncbi:MAG TPA: PIG-L family deacetylase [Terriglobia bacterium]|nr:PIG-L family deacetylase [Terriglobia bacterium]